MLTPLERMVLNTPSMRLREKVKLLRAARALVALDKDGRTAFRGPFTRWGTPLLRWMMIRLVVNNPRLVLLGLPATVLSWLVLIVNSVVKFY